MNKSEIVERYLTAVPKDYPTLTAAKDLRKMYPDIFASPESARTAVRYVRGEAGDKNREKRKDKKEFFPEFKSLKNKPTIPPPYRIKNPGKYLVIGDTHIPFHHQKSFDTAVNFGLQKGCKKLFINGDWADNTAFSRWFKNPRNLTPAQDLEDIKIMTEEIGKLFDEKYFKVGNHDQWWDNWIIKISTAALPAYQFPKFSFFENIELDKNGFEIIEDMQHAFLGKLPIAHGHELGRRVYSPVNPARGAMQRVYDNIVVNHWHRASSHPQKLGIKQKVHIARSIGCLCQLEANYQSFTEWMHGFAIVELEENGDYLFYNYIITDQGKVVVA